ncbi:MAG: type II secretion system protein GspF [Gammaproteobacteria bacterium RIFCSPHIGHO2_12_FULL_37_14]|nr:MAG: type II secretion system protein GspF [Gammaproteobacteria bacterium RIFCSPHIGHO2_12_FULL_37_14]
MSAFHYIAIDLAGQEKKGVIEAESEKHARQLLRNQSLIPIKIRFVQEKKIGSTSLQRIHLKFLKNGLNAKELSLFTRQFATLLSAGLPIEESLSAVAEQTEKSRIKGIILSVRSKVLEGHAFASALREHPECFSALYCATVAAGEKSGHLDRVLLRLADYTEQQWQMRRKLTTALIYPSMIILVAIGIVGFLLEYVVPKMISVYGHLNQNLPWLTNVLIVISNLVTSYGVYVLIGLVVGIYFWRRMLKKNNELREKVHLLLLRIPLIRYILRTANTARFSRTLSILSASGVPVLEAMYISAQLITTIPIRKAVELAVNHVREGAAIHLTLKRTTYFSPMSIHMIASGEASGQLENMLERVAQNQEDEISRMIEVGLALFEPAIILLMGIIVLFIVLAVLLPIFELNQFTG